jgi:hypothetical protein
MTREEANQAWSHGFLLGVLKARNLTARRWPGTKRIRSGARHFQGGGRRTFRGARSDRRTCQISPYCLARQRVV